MCSKTDYNEVLNLVAVGSKYSDPTDTSTILTEHASKAIQDMSEAIDALASADRKSTRLNSSHWE